jgi:CheY-like chemotaxis protein
VIAWLRENDASPAVIEPQRHLRILAVDDDGLVLMNTVALLEDLGHAVIEASSGDEALASLRDGAEIDLLITDQAMPGMTGIELVEAARGLIPGLPIILATGYGEIPEGAARDLVRLGKPFGQAQLASAIGDVDQARSKAPA